MTTGSDGIVLTDVEARRVRDLVASLPWYRSVVEAMRERVDTWLDRAPPIPVEKGLAFYEACPSDHAWLVFDPYAPHRHVCSKCGRDWTGATFDGAWIRQFQGWLAKRLVEAGILYRLEGDERHARAVKSVLEHFVNRYHDYPLANNLLGPTRLFQSTFLEAFWLVDVVAAYDLTRTSATYRQDDHDGIRWLLYESSGVVRSFDEGISNRQAFNNAGVGAVALLYDDEALLGHVLEGPHGLAFHLRESLTEDGIWYEGETYHFATLDHTLNLAEMARHRGIDLYHGDAGYGSLRPMFDGPLKVMLPDLTFPSRKDSWFGRGIGYHKDVFELAFARYGDVRYGGLLAHAYAHGHDRTDVSWRSFLYLEPVLPRWLSEEGAARSTDASAATAVRLDDLRSTHCEPMPGTGVAVLRRDEGRTYASLEYGRYGGGHGHPDRLHLTLHADGVHWLLDPGTGFYHLPELGWQRSTLAHNTVMLDGASQNPSEGHLEAFGSAGGIQAVRARVEGAYPGTTLTRSLCLGDRFLLDAIDVESDVEHEVDGSFHVRGDVVVDGEPPVPIGGALSSGGGHPFLAELHEVRAPVLDVVVAQEGRRLRVRRAGADRTFKARAMGIPLQEERPFHTFVTRRRGARTRIATVWSWGCVDVADVLLGADSGTPILSREGEAHTLIVDEQPGLALCSTGARGVTRVAWFGRLGASGPGFDVSGVRPLKAAALRWLGGVLHVDLPDDFGRIRVRGERVESTRHVEGLPQGARWHVDGDGLVLTQRASVDAWPTSHALPVPVFAGIDAALDVTVADYLTAQAVPEDGAWSPAAPSVGLPDRWILQGVDRLAVDPPLSTWRLRLRLPGDAARATVTVRVRGRPFDIEVVPSPPLDLDWHIESREGHAELSWSIVERAGRDGRAWAEVEAPWLGRAPGLFAWRLGAGRSVHARVPLPASPVPATAVDGSGADGDGGRGFDTEGAGPSVGEYGAAMRVQRAGFVRTARARFPLAWCLRREDGGGAVTHASLDSGDPVGLVRLDRVDQVYWSERPWGGPADASALARLAWDDRALTLDCRVKDDVHVTGANEEDPYENDSLQLYLDFRPPARQDSSFAPGVAAYVFAPDADRRSASVTQVAGSRELSNRGLAAPWFTTSGVRVDVAPRRDGYLLSARIPYASLGIAALCTGDVFRADLSLSDNDGGPYRRSQLVWSGARGDRRCYLRWAYLDPTRYGYVIVSAAPADA